MGAIHPTLPEKWVPQVASLMLMHFLPADAVQKGPAYKNLKGSVGKGRLVLWSLT